MGGSAVAGGAHAVDRDLRACATGPSETGIGVLKTEGQ